jgi:flagellar motor switch protein FliN/FliY
MTESETPTSHSEDSNVETTKDIGSSPEATDNGSEDSETGDFSGAEVTVNPASFETLKPKENNSDGITNLDMLLDINLRVSVELGRTTMTIREVLNLGPGTVIELDRLAGEPVDISINGKPIAKGEVVVIGDMFGVRVIDIISPSQRVESMR